MSGHITAPIASKHIGIGRTTLKVWSERVGIGRKNSSGQWFYSEEDLKVLEIVRHLRESENGFDTIIRKIKPETDAHGERLDADGEPPTAPVGVDVESISKHLIETIREQTALSEQYARATYEIGELRERVKNRDEKIAELQAQLAEAQGLLNAPKPRPWWRLW